MSAIGQPERATPNRVLALFRDELGYFYLGDWTDREGNSNVEEGLFTTYLTRRCYIQPDPDRQGSLRPAQRGEQPNRSLYDNNKAVHSLLRYGVPVEPCRPPSCQIGSPRQLPRWVF